VLFALATNRALAPSSKLAAARWVNEDVMIVGLPQSLRIGAPPRIYRLKLPAEARPHETPPPSPGLSRSLTAERRA
jgi:hypothetical protein